MMQKILYACSIIGLFLVLALILAVIVWEFYPYKVQTYIQPYHILNPNHEVKAGTPVIWKTDVVNLESYPYDAKQEIIGADTDVACDYKILKTSSGTSTPLGHIERIMDKNIVPEEFKRCQYYVQITVHFHVNPIRDITYIKHTENFRVVN